MKNTFFCAFLCVLLFGIKVGVYLSWKEGGFLGVLAFSAVLGVAGFIVTSLAGLSKRD